jgi:hypothetical protein
MYDVMVLLLPHGEPPLLVEYTGITDWTWPEGLEIKVSSSSSLAGPFVPSATLREHLRLEYYVTATQSLEDSLWRTRGQRPTMPAPQYRFAFRVPPEVAGSYLCVDAEWNHPRYGYLKAEKPSCVKIVAPCSEEAQHEAWTSEVCMASEQRRDEWAIALADSFVAMGWSNLRGLLDAGAAAKRIGRYDDAVRFLDICFERNHTINILAEKPFPVAPSGADRRLYEQARARIIDLKTQQEQQQPQH